MASFAAAKQSLQAAAKVELHQRIQAAKRLARESAERLAKAAGAWAEPESLLGQDELLHTCNKDDTLLVLRAPLRTGALFAEELRGAARHAGLPEALLKPLGGGLWLLRGGGTGAAAAARDALLAQLPLLAGVRLRLALHAAAADGPALLEAVAATPPRRERPGWTLHYEQHFPSADHNHLPFCHVGVAPALAIGLHGALGAGFVDGGGASGAEDVDVMGVLETKNALVLGALLPLPRAPPAGAAPPEASAPPAPPPGGGRSALPWWVPRWERRPFDFSASLDPLIAAAAVNLAAYAHVVATAAQGETKSLRSLRVYDPCMGSGTVVAAAAALGHPASGSDKSDDFVGRSADNFAWLGLAPAPPPSVHDATEPFPDAEGGAAPDLVVCNPPWGKNFKGAGGEKETGSAIVASVLKSFGGATCCFIAPALALEAALAVEGTVLVAHVRLGGVEAIVVRVDTAKMTEGELSPE